MGEGKIRHWGGNKVLALDFKLVAQNVRGLNDKEKRNTIFNFMRSKGSVSFLQETHSNRLIEQSWRDEWGGGSAIFSHGTSASRGCMILIDSILEHKIIDFKADEDGRYILAKSEIQGVKFFLMNVYAPNDRNEHGDFLEKLLNEIISFYDEDYYHIIQEGDWNHTPDNDMDRLLEAGVRPAPWKKSIEFFGKIQSFLNCSDVWRIRNPDTKQFSWHGNRRGRDLAESIASAFQTVY